MEQHNDNGGQASPHAEIERKSRRDDTPSFIRNVQSRAELLNPKRQHIDSLPVLTMPTSVKVWRTIRWPLAVLIVVVVLGTVGMITYDMLVARNVERTIEDGRAAEIYGAIDQIQAAGETLSSLAARHPERTNAQVAWAWQSLLQAVLLGPEEELTAEAEQALAMAGGDSSPTGMAARAALKHVRGDHEAALELAEDGLKEHPSEPRLELVRAWALVGLNEIEKARETFRSAIEESPKYMPLVIGAMKFEVDQENRLPALSLAEKLLAAAPGHLYASLVTIALALPSWGEPPPSGERIQVLMKDIKALKSVIESAPPKISFLGNYLIGRVNLLAEHHEAAIEALEKVVEISPEPQYVGWYALATKNLRGPDAALNVLDKYPSAVGEEILDLRARCLLAYHRVDTAAAIIEELDKRNALPRRERFLTWTHAVRSGDANTALESLPTEIHAERQLLAVNLYYLLKSEGDTDGIETLAQALDPSLSPCARAIRLWHENSPEEAIQALQTSDGSPLCLHALSSRLLRGHVPPSVTHADAKKVKDAEGLNLGFDVDWAWARWPVEGRAAALETLEQISQHKPEGAPLLCQMSRLYLALDMPEKVEAVLGGVEHPEALALRTIAARETDDTALAQRLLKVAFEKSKDTKHPALTYLLIDQRHRAGRLGDVSEEVTSFIPKAGHWASELAKIGAEALNSRGERTDADRLLYRTAKQVTEFAGLDESWDIRLAQINLNLRRGGKFMFRALYLLSLMKEEDIEDPRISYGYALANIHDGNERMGVRALREALDLDPTYRPAYKRLIALNRLDDETREKMKKTRPELVD